MAKLFNLLKKKNTPNAAEASGSSAEDFDEQITGLSDLYSPQADSASHITDAADVLVEMGVIDQSGLSQIRAALQNSPGRELEKIIAELNLADNKQILAAQAKLYGFEFRSIEPEQIDRKAFDKLDAEYIRSNSVMPTATDGKTLTVATSRPADLFVIEDVKRQTQMAVEVVVCSNEDIQRACEAFKDEQTMDYCVDDIISDMTDVEVIADEQKDYEDLEKMAGQSPVIKFVNYLISSAIHEGASDIHIEPKDKYTKIRYRIDGVLFENTQSPAKMHAAVVSRIKIMSNLDISERRLPQDGKVSVIVGGRPIDLRVSVLPTSCGEKVVIRILDSKSIIRGLEQLGMEPDVCDEFKNQVTAPHGILLVTGPTGSGKSTTLYSALCQMDGERLNISTVEDPVEYQLAFCNQVQTKESIGLDFASALRSLLRQDPDIIMIGEIRDNETARIAVQAALTGHLVLSTLHTNDAASSITRLVNIGIDAYLIAASLNAVLAQRLVRKICPDCKEPYKITDNIKKLVKNTGIDTSQLYHGKGCDKCRGSGYLGRLGIYEMLVVNERFRDMINKDPSASSMRRVFRDSGKDTLYEDGMKKVKAGLTTIEEVLRVTEVYGKNEKETFEENIK
jgi:type IV pilus assembly protein PilB